MPLSDLFDAVIKMISPAEAEAKVVGSTPQTKQLVDNVGKDSESGEFYQYVMDRAQARPETITIDGQKGLRGRSGVREFGEYHEYGPRVTMDQDTMDQYPDQARETVTHELLHHMFKQHAVENGMETSTDAQHRYMDIMFAAHNNMSRALQAMEPKEREVLQGFLSKMLPAYAPASRQAQK